MNGVAVIVIVIAVVIGYEAVSRDKKRCAVGDQKIAADTAAEIPPNHLAGREKQIEARLEAIRAELQVADFRAQLDDRHDWRVP